MGEQPGILEHAEQTCTEQGADARGDEDHDPRLIGDRVALARAQAEEVTEAEGERGDLEDRVNGEHDTGDRRRKIEGQHCAQNTLWTGEGGGSGRLRADVRPLQAADSLTQRGAAGTIAGDVKRRSQQRGLRP